MYWIHLTHGRGHEDDWDDNFVIPTHNSMVDGGESRNRDAVLGGRGGEHVGD